MELFDKATIVNKVLDKKTLSSILNYNVDNINIETVSIKNIINHKNTNFEHVCEYNELYVVEIFVNELHVPQEFLQKLDANIFFPTLYILRYKNIFNYIISIKEQKDNHVKILRVFDRGWGKEIENIDLNYKSILSIFRQLLKLITKVKFSEKQTFKEYITNLIEFKRKFLQIKDKKIDKNIINKGHSTFLQIKDSIKVLGNKNWDKNAISCAKQIAMKYFTNELYDELFKQLKEYMFQHCVEQLENKNLKYLMHSNISIYQIKSIFEKSLQTKDGTRDTLLTGSYYCYFTQATININDIYKQLYSI